MGTDLVIGKSQQVSKVCVVESLLSSFKLVLECHTHPEKTDPFPRYVCAPRLPSKIENTILPRRTKCNNRVPNEIGQA